MRLLREIASNKSRFLAVESGDVRCDEGVVDDFFIIQIHIKSIACDHNVPFLTFHPEHLPSVKMISVSYGVFILKTGL